MGWVKSDVPFGPCGVDFRDADGMDLGYARVSTAKQDLDRLGRTVRDTPNLIHDLAERGGCATWRT
jgi:hypothetical protein